MSSTPMASKRHSLFISPPGPRPLHLTLNHLHKPRRQSSISYNPRSRERDFSAPTSPLGPAARHVLTRSASLGPKTPRRSLYLPLAQIHQTSRPRQSVRPSRLQKTDDWLQALGAAALYRTERIQRKWERIVNRGFERHTSGIENTPSSGVVLEGIKEASASPTPHTRPTHFPSPSNSSVSTFSTTKSKSTRFSQSSTSSLGDEPLPPSPQPKALPPPSTPGPSPTRTFAPDTDASPLAVSPSASLGAAKIHRRKSRDAPPAPTPSTDDAPDSSKARRRSAGPSAFPPVSSIPGLGSLTVGGSGAPPVSSWVGKKWEELQRGSTCIIQYCIRALPAIRPILLSRFLVPSPSCSSPFPVATTCALSLLDDDDGPGFAASPVMTPDLRPAQLAPALIPTPMRTTQPAGTAAPHTRAPTLDEEDEWNW
ncbi:hypothetical protein BD779DRAFT_1530422 [Infundibulicybe gibba]|nr:hypothetical protein BD779DRAFT_1530422 [Infundibulicybe gibba]